MLPTKLRAESEEPAAEEEDDGELLDEPVLDVGSLVLGCCAVGVDCVVEVLGDCMLGSCDGDDVLCANAAGIITTANTAVRIKLVFIVAYSPLFRN
jgi:hypothetical protein